MSLRKALVALALFGLEACWLYALLSAANQAVAGALSVPLLLALLPLSALISSLLRRLALPRAALTLLSWLLWPVFMLAMLKVQLFGGVPLGESAWLLSLPRAFAQILSQFQAPLLVLLSTAGLWWLGRRLAYSKFDFSAALTETQLGLAALVLVVFSSYELELEQPASAYLSVAFFSLALAALALSHAQGESWFSSSRRGSWSTLLVVTIGVILLAGVLLSFIFTPDLIQLALRGLHWLWGLVEKLISFLISLFPSSSPGPGEVPTLPAIPPGDGVQNQGIEFPAWLKPALTLAWEILAGGLLLVAIWRIAGQVLSWARRHLPSSGAEVESLPGAFKSDLLALFRRLFGAIFRRNSPRGESNVPPPTSSVRQTYAQFLRWAAAAGHPRASSQTPEEFRRALAALLPESQAELEFLTREYMQARYGAVIPGAQNLIQVRQTWQNLRKFASGKFKKRKG